MVHTDSVHRHFNDGDETAVALVMKAKSAWMYFGLLQQGRKLPDRGRTPLRPAGSRSANTGTWPTRSSTSSPVPGRACTGRSRPRSPRSTTHASPRSPRVTVAYLEHAPEYTAQQESGDRATSQERVREPASR